MVAVIPHDLTFWLAVPMIRLAPVTFLSGSEGAAQHRRATWRRQSRHTRPV